MPEVPDLDSSQAGRGGSGVGRNPALEPAIPDFDMDFQTGFDDDPFADPGPSQAPPLELGAYDRPGAHDSSGPPLGAVVAAGDFFPSSPPPQQLPELTHERFAAGSAIATRDGDGAPLLIDVTPLSLRVETVGGYSDVLIPANSPVPCEKTRTFLTASDGQTVVFIRVAQGESPRFQENTHLGNLELSGLTPARRGEVVILVTFELDADGILNVRAKDKATNRETKAAMRLLGANTDTAEVAAMQARQARAVLG